MILRFALATALLTTAVHMSQQSKPTTLQDMSCKQLARMLDPADSDVAQQESHALGYWAQGFVMGWIAGSRTQDQNLPGYFGLSPRVAEAHVETYCLANSTASVMNGVTDLLEKVLKTAKK